MKNKLSRIRFDDGSIGYQEMQFDNHLVDIYYSNGEQITDIYVGHWKVEKVLGLIDPINTGNNEEFHQLIKEDQIILSKEKI